MIYESDEEFLSESEDKEIIEGDSKINEENQTIENNEDDYEDDDASHDSTIGDDLEAFIKWIEQNENDIEKMLFIKEAFDEEGIEMPFPQRTVWVKQEK